MDAKEIGRQHLVTPAFMYHKGQVEDIWLAYRWMRLIELVSSLGPGYSLHSRANGKKRAIQKSRESLDGGQRKQKLL